MKKNKLIMRWNSAKELWYMLTSKGRFIQEFFNCANVHKFFENLDMKKDNLYNVEITKESKMSESRSDYYVKVSVEVCGPKEKPVRLSGEYLGTNKDLAKGIQNKFGAIIAELNEAK
jgi:hypothetical protein